MDVRGRKLSRLAALAAGVATFAVAAPAASAANYSVTGTADGAPVACTPSGSDFSCPTLRSAVKAVDTAGGTNTITLPAGTYTLSNMQSTGQLVISNGSVTVAGAGAGKTIIDGANATRIFEVIDGANLFVSNLTLQHGNASGEWAPGGAIENDTEGNVLSVTDSTLDHNTASGNGGAIDAPFAGTVTVTDSTISNNTAGGSGGGIFAGGLDMSGSTANGNTATGGFGGGVFMASGVFDLCIPFCGLSSVHGRGLNNDNPSIVNSTIVNNSTGDGDWNTGGGVFVAPPFDGFPASVKAGVHAAQLQPPSVPGLASLSGDTIVGNSSVNGNGGNLGATSWEWFSTSLFIQGTIIGGGTAGDGAGNCSIDTDLFDGGSNLIFGVNDCFDPLPNDIVPGNSKLANGPGLETDGAGHFLLADNGGPTQTIALLAGSPAINAVTDAAPFSDAPVHAATITLKPDCQSDLLGLVLTTDQRGVQRPDVSGTACDIGAYETGAAPLTLTGSVSPNPGVGNPVTYSFTANNSGPAHGTHGTFDVTLPPGATFDSATPSQGTCSQTNSTTVDCSVGVIPDGSQSIAVAITPSSAGTYAVTATVSDRESGASAPLTLSASINGTTTTAASIIAPKPSTSLHACISRRDFPIHVQHLRRYGVVSATVYVNGKAEHTVRGKRMSAPIDLRQLPKGTFTITIVAQLRNGHSIRGHRTYHTCAAKLAGHKHLKL